MKAQPEAKTLKEKLFDIDAEQHTECQIERAKKYNKKHGINGM